MSRKKCIRKHYRLIDPIRHALEGACITPKAELDQLRVRELASLDAIAKGHGGIQEWSDINTFNNLCEYMANNGIGPEAVPACRELEKELITAQIRFKATGRMGFTGTGIQAARDVLEYHDLQRQSISRAEYERVIRTVTNMILSKSPHVTEIA